MSDRIVVVMAIMGGVRRWRGSLDRVRVGVVDPLSGPDGTAPVRDDDALAGTGALPPDRAPGDLRLPALPGPGTDRAAVQRWMDEDRARSTEPTAAERAQWTAPPRDVPPPRPVPRRPEPSPPALVQEAHEPAEVDDEVDDEPPWVRERREEHEFLSQFGEWRPGARPRGRRSSRMRAGPVLLVVLVLVVLVAWALLH